ncbi:MAG: type II toxin-antitoxin system RelE/ParE family toxin [Oscillospiraceae bacterium]|jgi:addiction module RelE/StbE family toxin|nr:type II toxin-antitoxin system RelE/ParE family toxin [Oscillospiraceae bacterium]
MNKLQFSPLARQDLQDIKTYIEVELQNPVAAVNVITKIIKHLHILVDHPRSGAPLSSVVDAETDYRFLVCGNYTAFYHYEDETVYVVRVLYGRRDYMKILFGELPDEEIEK